MVERPGITYFHVGFCDGDDPGWRPRACAHVCREYEKMLGRPPDMRLTAIINSLAVGHLGIVCGARTELARRMSSPKSRRQRLLSQVTRAILKCTSNPRKSAGKARRRVHLLEKASGAGG